MLLSGFSPCQVGVFAGDPEQWGFIASALGSGKIGAEDKIKFDLLNAIMAYLMSWIASIDLPMFTKKDKYYMMCIAVEMTNVTRSYRGVLITLKDAMVPGIAYTAFLNSEAQAIYERNAWFFCLWLKHPCPLNQPNVRALLECADYGNHNDSYSYGDDNVKWVSDFAHMVLYESGNLDYAFDIQGSPTSKADKTTPITSTTRDETEFLKRGFLFIDNEWRCPLAIDSVHKSLLWKMSNSALSDCDHMVAVFDNARRQMFMYGEERFNEHVAWETQQVSRLSELDVYFMLDSKMIRKTYAEIYVTFDGGSYFDEAL
jgi:hypothetical protein